MATKAITTPANITSISSRQDGSLRFSTETPELSISEKVAFMNLQGLNLRMLIQPEESDEKLMEVKAPMEGKTQSQRLRGVIFIYWDQKGRPDTFNVFYEKTMEKIIEGVKSILDE